MKFVSLSITAHLALAIGALATAIGAGAAAGWWNLVSLDTFVARTIRGDVALAQAAADMHEDVLQMRRFEKDVFINIGAADSAASYYAKWVQAYQDLRRDLLRARAVAPATLSAPLRDFTDSIAEYRDGFERTYGRIQAGDLKTSEQANAQMTEYKDAVRGTEKLVEDIRREAQERISLAGTTLSARGYNLGVDFIVLTGIALLFAAVLHASLRANLRSRRK
jgi:methyl-accepting chemotaxis protein